MENKLKPCPFCGNTDVYSSPHVPFIVCKKCRCWGPKKRTVKQAIDAWNRRAGEE